MQGSFHLFHVLILMQVMQELGLIGLRIQRMPSESELEFGIPSQYNYMTVKTLCYIALSIEHFIGYKGLENAIEVENYYSFLTLDS